MKLSCSTSTALWLYISYCVMYDAMRILYIYSVSCWLYWVMILFKYYLLFLKKAVTWLSTSVFSTMRFDLDWKSWNWLITCVYELMMTVWFEWSEFTLSVMIWLITRWWIFLSMFVQWSVIFSFWSTCFWSLRYVMLMRTLSSLMTELYCVWLMSRWRSSMIIYWTWWWVMHVSTSLTIVLMSWSWVRKLSLWYWMKCCLI